MAETYTVDSKTGKATITKDPDAVLDYVFDWTEWLDGVTDTLSTAAPVMEEGDAVVESHTIVGKKVHVWVSGGTAGSTSRLRCRIATAGGRVDDRSVFLKIKER